MSAWCSTCACVTTFNVLSFDMQTDTLTALSSSLIHRITHATRLDAFACRYVVGLELNPTTLFHNAKHTLAISATGIVVPFLLGSAGAIVLYQHQKARLDEQRAQGHEVKDVPFASFLLFTVYTYVGAVWCFCLVESRRPYQTHVDPFIFWINKNTHKGLSMSITAFPVLGT